MAGKFKTKLSGVDKLMLRARAFIFAICVNKNLNNKLIDFN